MEMEGQVASGRRSGRRVCGRLLGWRREIRSMGCDIWSVGLDACRRTALGCGRGPVQVQLVACAPTLPGSCAAGPACATWIPRPLTTPACLLTHNFFEVVSSHSWLVSLDRAPLMFFLEPGLSFIFFFF
jgi:hypothetical protein